MSSETILPGFYGPFLDQNPVLDESDSSEEDALRLISQMLMEENDFEDRPCMEQEESLALEATERSFYDVLEESDSLEDETLRYISQMLMEEGDIGNKPCVEQELLALQATERSFYDVLEESDSSEDEALRFISQMLIEEGDIGNMNQESLALLTIERSFYDVLGAKYPPGEKGFDLTRISDGPDDNVLRKSCVPGMGYGDFNWISEREKIERSFYAGCTFASVLQSICSTKVLSEVENFAGLAPQTNLGKRVLHQENIPNRSVENEDGTDAQIKKQLASSNETFDEQPELFDELFLCTQPIRHLDCNSSLQLGNNLDDGKIEENSKLGRNGKSKRGKGRKKREDNNKEVVDLTTLLIRCAEAISISDMHKADELLKKIRQHSSPYGDGYERVAHYFANALEARAAGTGTAMYTASDSRLRVISSSDLLQGYQTYIEVSPFSKMSIMFSNRSIVKVAKKATRIHIIELGILHGLQYPSLIQQLSELPDGPPKLRLTGIDFPLPGFRPAETIECTGRRLATYSQRFDVPFEYIALAKKWETIELSDLKIEQDEVVVVNCLFRMRNLPDETVIENSPRDAVLNLIKRINPNIFILGNYNATYTQPIFLTRFKDALFSFRTKFDMFEANASREEPGRLVCERDVYAKDIMNVVACEGSERVERPESYKQWHYRITRAGLSPVQLDKEIVNKVRAKVKAHYHKDYVLDEHNYWMLLGWKGRIFYGMSCWKSAD